MTSPTPDANPTDNTATDPTRIATLADLALTKSAGGAFVVGQTATYSLTITNRSPSRYGRPLTKYSGFFT